MTNEETLELLKPIMLDGSEKVGDKVYCLPFGEVEITDIKKDDEYPIFINVFGLQFSIHGYNVFIHKIPTLFKCNPFEWLASRTNNQERVIEVKYVSGEWRKRVLLTVKDGYAICWWIADDYECAKGTYSTTVWREWREVPIQKRITKEEALKMLAKNGVDTTNLIIE